MHSHQFYGRRSTKDAYGLLFQGFPDVLTVPQLSRMLNINEKTAYQLVREKQINHFQGSIPTPVCGR